MLFIYIVTIVNLVILLVLVAVILKMNALHAKQLTHIDDRLDNLIKSFNEILKLPIYQVPPDVAQKIEATFALKTAHKEVIIRDKATNHILARRHADDPEVQEALLDEAKIVIFD